MSSLAGEIDVRSLATTVAPYPSYRRLPGSAPRGVTTILDFLVHRYPKVPRAMWEWRFERGLVMDARGARLPLDAPFVPGAEVRYFKEILGREPRVRAEVEIVHEDEHLVVADKPHFLPVIPSGPYLHNCLLTMLREVTSNGDLVPLHRIDRDAAGLVAFGKQPNGRGALARIFLPGGARKSYRAVCAARGEPLAARFTVEGTIVLDTPFWKRRLVATIPGNSHTRGRVLARRDGLAYVRLDPRTGRTHQLRVHMASLGWPIVNDRVYGEGGLPDAGGIDAPLQLLARTLDFVHPVTGKRLFLRSRRRLWSMVLL